MRLQRYIMNESIDINEWVNILEDECQPYLKECRKVDMFLYRGSDKSNSSGVMKIKPRTERKPKDTPIAIHNFLDDGFKKKFGWKVRSEGVFVCSNLDDVNDYGYPYIFFPIDKFKYVWSPRIEDVLLELRNDRIIDSSDIIIGHIKDHEEALTYIVNTYKDKDLAQAITKEVEISVKCKQYYMFDVNKFDKDFRRELL